MFGFIYGVCSPVFKFIVMSRKSIIFLFASIVILRLFSLNILQISFLIFSVSNGVLSHIANPSSLYRPMFIPNCSSYESMYSPTSSHVSAPS